MHSQYPKSRKANIVVLELDGEVLVYDEKTDKAFNLNETSALIWELCDGQHSLSEISWSLGEKLNATIDDGLVWLALEQLGQADLVEHESALPDSLIGLSRRQAIRKIGLAAMITLPFISSLVAPTAIHAAASTPMTSPTPRVPISVPVPINPLAPLAPIPVFGRYSPVNKYRR